MVNFTYDEAVQIAADAGCTRVPLAREIMSDAYTPVNVLRMLRNVSDHCFLLESVAGESREWGRYSFLGYQPTLGITCVNGHVEAGALKIDAARPSDYLRQLLDAYRLPRVEGLPPFTGGLVGYFSYDYLKYAEPTLRLDAQDTEGFKDVDLMLFDKVIVFDNCKQKILLIVDADLGEGEAGYRKALRDLDEMERLLADGEMAPDEPGHLTTPARELFDEATYGDMVRTAQAHIREGDIFQVVLSNRLEAGYEGTLLNAYRTLRTINPSPYLFYFTGTDVEVAGASPETLVKLEDGVLHTFPLAGTRPRGATPAEDAAVEADLLADPKELAEHNMLVDL
ncbi:MAG: chorismate-binding protein, partial [Eggerthellaceae bacterium]|nr:chorismate-binding protein [Eggerthellaceae bacterium]